MDRIKVLMVGPARSVKGGMTTVVDNYIMNNTSGDICVDYFETINDKNVFSKLLFEIKAIAKFKRKIGAYDIIHIHMASRRSTFRKLLYVKIAKKNNKKVVLHIHGGGFKTFYEDECSNSKKKYINKYLNMVDHVIVLSDEWKEYYSTIVNAEKITVIYNGVAVPSKFNKDFNNHNIFFMGRICQEKGIFDLIDVFQKIQKKYPDAVLNVCGNDDKGELQKTITKKGLEKSVNILGWIKGDEKESQLINNSIFVLPSYIEAMPMSILEAMSYYNFVISTNVGSIPTVLENGKCGIVIQPGDLEALYSELDNIMMDSNINNKISIAKNGRKKIEKEFNLAVNIEKTNDIYKSLLMK